MAERGAAQPLGMFSRKPLFCLFTVAASLIVSSWFFLLGSTGSPEFIEQNLQRNEKMYSLQENHTAISRIDDNFHSESPTNLITRPPEEQMPSPSPPPPEQPPPPPTPQCDPTKPILKVFMYDLPPEFHFGLLDWKPEGNVVWPDIRTKIPSYPGGLNLQHSIEYWLTLDLLSSKFPDRTGPCTAVRVDDVNDSDVVFVPFFSSLSYNRHSKIRRPEKTSRNKVLQAKLVQYLTSQKEWKRSRGMDHVILAHHPNSMLDARMKLWPCMFILSDFGRYPPNVANVDKDVIAPYRHVIKSFINDSSGFDDRPILLYFQGAIYRKDGGFVRQELFYLLRGEKDVHFTFGSVQGNGINKASQGMHSSKFCLNIAGDTPSSNRLFDAIASHCVPVIISDEIELPYEDVLDYSEFCIFVRTSDAVKKGFLIRMIRGISRERWTQMWGKLKEVEGYFEFQYPSTKDDAIQMIWQALARKVPLVRRKLHKSWRFSRPQVRRLKLKAV